jgi:hypothetical protein
VLNRATVRPIQCSSRDDASPAGRNQSCVRQDQSWVQRIQVAVREDACGAVPNRLGVRMNRVPEWRDACPVRRDR